MLKLYNFHASSTSYRTRIVLNLKGLPYEYIPIRLDKAEHLDAAYGEINPMRGVPTLEVDGGARLYQSGAIIEYLEEVYPEPPLLPKHALGRAQVRAIAGIVGADMHAVNNLRIRKFIAQEYGQTPEGVAAWIGLWNGYGLRRSRRCCGRIKGAALFVTAHPRRLRTPISSRMCFRRCGSRPICRLMRKSAPWWITATR